MSMSFVRTVTVLAASFGSLALVGCDSFGPQEPAGPGAIFVDLRSPNGEEGAAVFEIESPEGLGEITSLGGWLYQEDLEEKIRVVAILTTPGAIQFQVRADDVQDLPVVRVIQVAGPGNELRSLDGYRVDLFQMADRRTP
jgi:hypothetical protein